MEGPTNPPDPPPARGARGRAIRRDLPPVLVALALASWLGWHYSALGFMPLDQSICFDGGWRILNGEVPLRDYLAPSGFPVHALQALFFGLFGVEWTAYRLHAACANALAVWLAFRLLARFGLRPWGALVFALATGFVFYPPFGVPYMDTHAFLFSLAALVAALAAALDARAAWRRAGAWAVGPLLALAFLSKQIPSAFFLPLCLAIGLCAPGSALATVRRMLASLALTALALGLAAWLLGIDLATADLYMRALPSEEAARRLSYWPQMPSLAVRFERMRVALDLGSIAVLHAAGALALVGLLLRLHPGLRARSRPFTSALGAALLGELLLLCGLTFNALTNNDVELGMPLVFCSAGLVAAALARAGAALGPRARRGSLVLAFALGALVARDAWSFHLRVNPTRIVNDMRIPPGATPPPASELPGGLAGLRWFVPPLVAYAPRDLRELALYLRAREGAFFLVGDAAVLYGITGKPSVFPALWYHVGLTFPLPHDPRFEAFEDRLLERLERLEVRTVVIEPRVWVGYLGPGGDRRDARYVTLDTFPRVAAWVAERAPRERSFGAFRVLELR